MKSVFATLPVLQVRIVMYEGNVNMSFYIPTDPILLFQLAIVRSVLYYARSASRPRQRDILV